MCKSTFFFDIFVLINVLDLTLLKVNVSFLYPQKLKPYIFCSQGVSKGNIVLKWANYTMKWINLQGGK